MEQLVVRAPDESEARAFALMLDAGLPPEQAILYFMSEEEQLHETFIGRMLNKWSKSRAVKAAVKLIHGKGWEEMGLEERIEFALKKQYTEMAYFLYSRNFTTVGGAEWQKAVEARKVLEAKQAGTSGRDPLEQFWRELREKKVVLSGGEGTRRES